MLLKFNQAVKEKDIEKLAKLYEKKMEFSFDSDDGLVESLKRMLMVGVVPTDEFFEEVKKLPTDMLDMVLETIWDATSIAGFEMFCENNLDDDYSKDKLAKLKKIISEGGAITNSVVKYDFPETDYDSEYNSELFVRRHLLRSGVNLCDGVAMSKKKLVFQILEDEETDGKLDETEYKNIDINDTEQLKKAFVYNYMYRYFKPRIHSGKGIIVGDTIIDSVFTANTIDYPSDDFINKWTVESLLSDLVKIVKICPDSLSLEVAIKKTNETNLTK